MVDWVDEKMLKTLEAARHNLASVRTGRANPDILKRIMVDYYGSLVPIQQLATLSAPEPKTLQVQVFDRGAIHSVEKAIQKSDLGMNPNTDGNIIRLKVPDMTEERRRDLDKVIRKISEEGRIAIRNVRRDALEHIKKDDSISEDDKKRQHDQVQKLTDEYVKKIDEALAQKEKDLKEI